jgi:hypothetical protein
MIIYAQIETGTNKLQQFAAFQHEEMAYPHIGQFPNCFFVQTPHFGSPDDFEYDPATETIKRKEA